jgi:hypothetical protein
MAQVEDSVDDWTNIGCYFIVSLVTTHRPRGVTSSARSCAVGGGGNSSVGEPRILFVLLARSRLSVAAVKQQVCLG